MPTTLTAIVFISWCLTPSAGLYSGKRSHLHIAALLFSSSLCHRLSLPFAALSPAQTRCQDETGRGDKGGSALWSASLTLPQSESAEVSPTPGGRGGRLGKRHVLARCILGFETGPWSWWEACGITHSLSLEIHSQQGHTGALRKVSNDVAGKTEAFVAGFFWTALVVL